MAATRHKKLSPMVMLTLMIIGPSEVELESRGLGDAQAACRATIAVQLVSMPACGRRLISATGNWRPANN